MSPKKMDLKRIKKNQSNPGNGVDGSSVPSNPKPRGDRRAEDKPELTFAYLILLEEDTTRPLAQLLEERHFLDEYRDIKGWQFRHAASWVTDLEGNDTFQEHRQDWEWFANFARKATSRNAKELKAKLDERRSGAYTRAKSRMRGMVYVNAREQINPDPKALAPIKTHYEPRRPRPSQEPQAATQSPLAHPHAAAPEKPQEEQANPKAVLAEAAAEMKERSNRVLGTPTPDEIETTRARHLAMIEERRASRSKLTPEEIAFLEKRRAEREHGAA
jgi:hypothetical protein